MSRPAGRRPRDAAQVMVKATAAAATIKTAAAAASTVTQVASWATSQLRRARNAACLGGTIGMAGRGSTGMEGSPRCKCARNAHTGSSIVRAVKSARLLRRPGQERGHEHDEASRQPHNFHGQDGDHRVTHGRFTRNDSSQLISVASVRYGSFLFASREQNVAAGRPGRRPAGWKPIRTIEKSRASPRRSGDQVKT